MFLNLSETPQSISVTLTHKLYFEFKMNIGEGTSFRTISNTIKQYWNCRIRSLRLFTCLGCELMEDDLKYLINDEKLFVSLSGEAFDVQNIYFSYLILKRLQRGVIAVHETTQNKMVIKHSQIQMKNANSLDNILSWIKEIRYNKYSSSNIEHCGLINNNLIQIRKFQSGKSFQQLSKKNKLSEQNAQKYFLQIAQILFNQQHRNLPLGNIILDNQVIHLVDFNYKNNSELYTTPEQILNNDVDSSDQDVWSFGVILYRMIYGIYPFGDIDDDELRNNIIFCRYQTTNLKVSKELKNLLSRIFIISPERRITMHGILNHPFFSKNQELEYTEIEINEKLFISIKPRIQIDPVILMRRRLQKMSTETSRNRQPSRQRARSVFYC